MCGTALVRYWHYLEHPNYPERIGTGYVCAGALTEDYVGSKARDEKMKFTDRQRKRWLSRRWKISQKGNEYLNISNVNVVIFSRGTGWSFRLLHRTTSDVLFPALSIYETSDAAKMAAFERMLIVAEQEVFGATAKRNAARSAVEKESLTCAPLVISPP
jgi:hypothetical protein